MGVSLGVFLSMAGSLLNNFKVALGLFTLALIFSLPLKLVVDFNSVDGFGPLGLLAGTFI